MSGDQKTDPDPISKIDWAKIRNSAVNSGYKEGMHDGKQAKLQEGFDNGYESGMKMGMMLGLYNEILSSIAHAKAAEAPTEKDPALEKPSSGDCQICPDETLLNKPLREVRSKQKAHNKAVKKRLKNKYPNVAKD